MHNLAVLSLYKLYFKNKIYKCVSHQRERTETYNWSYITEQWQTLHQASPHNLPTTIKLQNIVQQPSQFKYQLQEIILMIVAIHKE